MFLQLALSQLRDAVLDFLFFCRQDGVHVAQVCVCEVDVALDAQKLLRLVEVGVGRAVYLLGEPGERFVLGLVAQSPDDGGERFGELVGKVAQQLKVHPLQLGKVQVEADEQGLYRVERLLVVPADYRAGKAVRRHLDGGQVNRAARVQEAAAGRRI